MTLCQTGPLHGTPHLLPSCHPWPRYNSPPKYRPLRTFPDCFLLQLNNTSVSDVWLSPPHSIKHAVLNVPRHLSVGPTSNLFSNYLRWEILFFLDLIINPPPFLRHRHPYLFLDIPYYPPHDDINLPLIQTIGSKLPKDDTIVFSLLVSTPV